MSISHSSIMKLFATASATFVFVAASDAAAPSTEMGRSRLGSILSNAVPVNSNGKQRSLENDYDAFFYLTAGDSVQFSECISLKTEPYNDEILFAQSLLPYTTKGQVVSQQSYVLFNVCNTKSDCTKFMIDLDSYMAATSEYYVDQRDTYCSACQDSRNYCR